MCARLRQSDVQGIVLQPESKVSVMLGFPHAFDFGRYGIEREGRNLP
jgi:hypothetical protein